MEERSESRAFEALREGDLPDRLSALLAVRRARNVAALPVLLELLDDPERRIRKGAAEALGSLDDDRAIEPLLRALGDKERGIQVDAVEALGELGRREAVPALVDSLADVRLRSAIPTALARIGDDSVVPRLIELLEDPSQHVRRNTAMALGSLRRVDAIPGLVRAMVDVDTSVRQATENALRRFEEERVRELAADQVKVLLEALGNENWMIRASACRAIMLLRSPEAAEPLRSLLSRETACGVLIEIEEALGVLGDREAVPTLLELVADRGWDVRAAAITALARIGDARGYRPAVKGLSDREAGVRRAALEALVRHEDPRAAAKMRKLLRDRVSAVRKTAAWALGEFRDAGSRSGLRELLSDVDPEVQEAARIALTRIGA